MTSTWRDTPGFSAPMAVSLAAPKCVKSAQPRRRAAAWPRSRAYRPRWAMCSPAPSDPVRSAPQAESEVMPDMLYDELVSDDDYVVIDGKDVGLLIEELRAKGLDDIDSPGDHVEDSLLSAAERVAEAKSDSEAPTRESGEFPRDSGDILSEFRVPRKSESEDEEKDRSGAKRVSRDSPGVLGEGGEHSMQYFTDENMPLMPSWARAAFLDGSHQELQNGASRVGQGRGTGRLEAIVAAGKASDISHLKQTTLEEEFENVESNAAQGLNVTDELEEASANGSARVSAADAVDVDEEDWIGAGILDCTVADVAVDYNIPLEMVSDVMLVYGVKPPIKPHDDVRERLTMEEIERMLELITSFDAMDLSDRYSDHTIADLAEDYDVDVAAILHACELEGVFLVSGQDTRLQLSREDRILDIARGRANAGGHEYPSLLHGLVVGENPIPSSTFVQS